MLRFRHPLVRSGVLHTANDPARRAAHRALAQLLDHDPGRRAWHRSETVLVDEEIAADLEVAAARAVVGGGARTALALIERAVDRSEDPGQATRRAVWGAEVAVVLGDRATGDRLLARVPPGRLGWAVGLALLLHEEEWTPGTWTDDEVADLLTTVARVAGEGRPDLALRVLHRLTHSPWPHVRRPVLETVETLFARYGDEPMGLLMMAAVPANTGLVMASAREALARPDLDAETRRIYATAATRAYDFDLGRARLPGIAEELLAQGRRAAAGQALVSLAWCHLHLGRFDDAGRVAAQAEILARENHQSFWELGSVMAQAWLDGLRPGTTDPDRRVHTVLAELPGESLTPLHRAMYSALLGSSALGAARYGRSADLLRELFSGESYVRWWATGDYAEACLRSDRTAELGPVLDRLEGLVDATSSRFLADQLAFARALLADGEDADTLVAQALDHAPLQSPFLRARLALAHGIRLRRARRVRHARARLTQAGELLAGLGPTVWDEAVARELSATGERQAGTPTDEDGLTPQERQVVVLAGRGLSNREIADQLIVSPRTVSTHLHRAFRKLGIRSRQDIDPAALES